MEQSGSNIVKNSEEDGAVRIEYCEKTAVKMRQKDRIL